MTKVVGALAALLIVGIVVTTRTHSAAGPACPAAPSGHAAVSTNAGHR